ncbi:MAG: hypothetical protein ABDK92_10775, partial [Atribacterota bacterium]
MKRRFVLVLLVSMVAFVMGFLSIGWAKVVAKVLEGVYVLPVAELATTKTHPEVIKVENELMEVTIIPNRGRVLSSYLFKGEESGSFFYQELVPKPMILPNGLHVVEFGGYYLSLPWNDRDRQPFDLSFTLTRQEEDFAEVLLSGRDLFRKTLTECWVRVREGSPIVEVEIGITNLSKNETKTLSFRDFAVLNVDEDCLLALPVETLKVVESRNDWFGKPGLTLRWPATLVNWSSIKDYIRFVTESSLALPLVALVYPSRNIAFVKWWEPREVFSNCEVWSWGQSGVDEP